MSMLPNKKTTSLEEDDDDFTVHLRLGPAEVDKYKAMVERYYRKQVLV